jgi:hypothetical protein
MLGFYNFSKPALTELALTNRQYIQLSLKELTQKSQHVPLGEQQILPLLPEVVLCDWLQGQQENEGQISNDVDVNLLHVRHFQRQGAACHL